MYLLSVSIVNQDESFKLLGPMIIISMLQVCAKNILPNLTASSVGCSPSGGRVGSRSWILNQEHSYAAFSLTCFILLPFQIPTLTCGLCCCHLSFISELCDNRLDKTAGWNIMSTLSTQTKIFVFIHLFMIYTTATVIYYHSCKFLNIYFHF